MRFTGLARPVGATGWRVALATMLLSVLAVPAMAPGTAGADAVTSAPASVTPRFLNLHQCVYSSTITVNPFRADLFTKVLPSGAIGGTNVSDLPESGVNCPSTEGSGIHVPGRSGVVALDLTAGRYLNLHQCAYFDPFGGGLFTKVLPSGAVGGTNVSSLPESGVNCPSTEGGLIHVPGRSGVVALDLQG